jgi:hypothetical protein
MATSPIYGWLEPDNSDLVKNGALAIRTLGNAIDTTMATMTPKSIVDAKGDLIAASAADTPARLAVGANGETLVADSSTSTGLRYQQQNIKNYAYNSNFDIWQRGTSFNDTSGYFADRWTNSGVKFAITASRQTSGAPVGSYYYMRHTATAASAYWSNYQYLETQDVEELWGKTVTLSVKLRRNATTNNAGLVIKLDKTSTVDAGAGATWTTIGSTSVALASIPTGSTSADWFTASFTVTVPSDATANSLRILMEYNGATASGSVYDFSQVMLQVGSVVTAYQRQNVTLQGELAACQRYFYAPASNSGGAAFAFSSTSAICTMPFAVTMRATPSMTYTPANIRISNTGADITPSAAANALVSANSIIFQATLTGLTLGNGCLVYVNSASAITASAEL